MCAIAGCVGSFLPPDTHPLVHSLLDVVAHRGPDGSGVFQDSTVWFGHRRLAIVDLSEGGAQPMHSPDGDRVITYNGEIYNHVELRTELEALGHRFRSHSDTEVILAAHAAWGDDCVSRFNGMWAFAIWDRRQRRLFCSRDRFGVKPFHFLERDGGLVFGSELRQLLPFLPRVAANREIVQTFLITGMSDHVDDGFFAGIRRLPAGHNLSWTAGARSPEIRRYFRLERLDEVTKLGKNEAQLAFDSLLLDAVRLRLRSDVPVGTCLSGGLDSSTVAALAAPLFRSAGGERFSAITAVSEQADNSEEALAGQVAQACDLRWLRVCPGYDDLMALLPKVVEAQEEPFGSAGIVMQHVVMQRARAAGIPVLLDGQGGDETLLGYKKYVAAYLAGQWRDAGWQGLRNAIRAAGQNNASWSAPRLAMYWAGSRMAGLRYRYHRWEHRYLTAAPPLPAHLTEYARASSDNFELQRLEIEKTNLPALLRYEDRNSMAHSVETRLPFLDYRLVQLALSLPGHMKIREGWSKWVLRRTAAEHLPPDVVWRRTKFGFEAPERIWQQQLGPDMKSAIVQSELLQDLIDPRRLLAGFDALPLRAQWRLYSVARWAERFGVRQWA